MSVFVDLFRQRLALEAAQVQLERSVRMRDDFMSLVSHELRNPLNTVFLQAQLRKRLVAGDTPIDREAMLKMVDRDERQIKSMIRLLDDMLDVSRLRTGRLAMAPGPMDLAQLVHRAVEAMAEQAKGSGAELTLHGPEHVAMTGDEFRIEQVVTNLLTNALRYGENKPVAVEVKADGAWATVSVKDQGKGIAQADQDRIFEQFERADSARTVPGLGLGLFISRQIVQAHGGDIAVRSTPGPGAQFIVRLPLEATAS